MNASSYTWVSIVLVYVYLWRGLRSKDLLLIERLCLAAASITVVLVFAIGISLFFSGRLRLLIILPLTSSISFLVLKTLRNLKKGGGVDKADEMHSRAALLIMFVVMVVGFGRQFQYQSFWGDIGVYLTAAKHYKAGGHVSFAYNTIAFAVPPDLGRMPALNGMNPASNGLYQFHALPGWPALMALLGLPEGGSALLSILFALAIGLFYSIGRRITGDSRSALMAAAVFASLPLAWFQMLYPTAEMLTLVLVLSAIMLSVYVGLSPLVIGLAIFSYGTVHISLVVIAPLIGIALAVAGLYSEPDARSGHCVTAAIATLSCLAAGVFEFHTSQKYSYDISNMVFHHHGWLFWVASASPMIGVTPYLFSRFLPSMFHWLLNLDGWIARHCRAIAYSSILLIGAAVVIECYLLGWSQRLMPKVINPYSSASARAIYIDHGFASVAHLSILSMVMATGLIGMLAFFLAPARWSPKVSAPRYELALWFVALYLTLIFGVSHADITNNYYASRYFIPTAVPASLLLSIVWLRHTKYAPQIVFGVCCISLVYVSALIGQGFYLGDRRFTRQVLSNVDLTKGVYIDGSQWLRFQFDPYLSKTFLNDANSERKLAINSSHPQTLITDDANVLGGSANCYTYAQRREPWQIGYPLHTYAEDHDVCVVSVASRGVLTFPANNWLLGGEIDFIAVSPSLSGTAYIEIDSDGWWAMNKLYSSNLPAIKPVLTICGSIFPVQEITPKHIIFKGVMSAPFCQASLTTATFVPKDIGLGDDPRVLGMDMSSIRIYHDEANL